MWRLVSRRIRIFIFALLLFSLTASLLFRLYLRYRLSQYEAGNAAAAASDDGLQQLLPDLEETAEEARELSTDYREELSLLEEETAALEVRQGGMSLRERKKRVAELWGDELQRMSEDIAAGMPEEERQAFLSEQRSFLYTRRHTLMKDLDSNFADTSESIAYLTDYTLLTRERCYELLEKYLA